jgi:pimeloyl-ACP methyl ester carboxylesterase
LNGLCVTEIVDHYDGIIRGLDRPPIVMGHSFGGLVTQLLLDRGLGAAGVALSPAPVKGVLRLPPAQLRSAFPVPGNPANRNKTVELTLKQFNYAFTNTMTEDEANAAYDRYEVPGPGRVIFQAAFANFNPRAVTKADFHKDDRPPLLIIETVRTTRSRPRSARRRRSAWASRGRWWNTRSSQADPTSRPAHPAGRRCRLRPRVGDEPGPAGPPGGRTGLATTSGRRDAGRRPRPRGGRHGLP